MGFIRALLTNLGVLSKTRLIDRLSPYELKEMEIKAHSKRTEELIDLLRQYKKIYDGEINTIIELGAFVYDKDKLRDVYRKLNDEEFNSLVFDSAKEFIPTADYVEVFYLKMADDKRYIFVIKNRYEYFIEPRIDELFGIKEDYAFDLSQYPNRTVYYDKFNPNCS